MRPKLPPGQARDSRIHLRVSRSDHDQLREIAKAQGLGISALIQRWINLAIQEMKKPGNPG